MRIGTENEPRNPLDGRAVAGAIDDAEAIERRVNRARGAGGRVEQLLTVAEAAQCVGCCQETIRRAYLARQLQVLRFGARRVRIRPAALTAWLERGGKTTAA
jgi:excisionase family DNA binding protein